MAACDVILSAQLLKPLWSPEALMASFHPRTGETAVPDFIQQYVKYADVIEAPPEAHQAVAVSLLAAVLNESVHIQNGALKISLDMWIVLLSGSGLGRNTLINLARPVLNEAGVTNLLINTMWGSREAFYQDISERSSGLFLWPELSIVLKSLKDARFAGVKEWVTDRYDNPNIPDAITYRHTGKKSDTPSIVFYQPPRLNILATSSYDWFVSSLEQQDSTGGFIPRWVIYRLAEPARLIPTPKETDKSLLKPLADHLRRASELKGAVDISQVKDMYDLWYRETHERFLQQQNGALAMPYYNRLKSHVLKLAAVYEVSRSLSLCVSPESMEKAMELATKIEQTIFSLLPTGLNQEGYEIDRIAERIRSAGSSGILKSELTRAFQSMKRRDRDDRIHTLTQAGVIHQFWRKTTGRAAEVLVHKNWLEEHKNKFHFDEE